MASPFPETDVKRDAEPDADAKIRQMIALHPGSRLPGERDLAARLSISRVKLRSVLQRLSAEGLIESRRGSGTYGIDPNARLRSVTLFVDGQIKLGDDPFFSRLVDLVQTALQRQAIRCVIERTDNRTVFGHSGDLNGAMTIGQMTADDLERIGRGMPLVALMPGKDARPRRRMSLITLLDRDAGREAARILIAHGCRTIVFAGRLGVDASEDRHAGASDAAHEAGATFERHETPLNYLGGLRLADALRPALPGQSGVIAMNDWLAVGLRSGLGDFENRSLPIVSFDGLPISAEPSLGIASLAVPLEEIACDAVLELQRLSRPHGPSGRTLSYRPELREQPS